MADREELERALDAPWEKWAVFLHPAQRALVGRDYGGPARVAGSAGTGKTIVALHRAVHLAESDPDSRVLLATFSEPLAEALRRRLRLLIGNRPRLGERIEVQSMAGLAPRLYELNVGALKRASADQQRELLHLAGKKVPDHGFSDRFLWAEWSSVVDVVEEDRRGTVSVFNGPEPEIRIFGTVSEETAAVGDWLRKLSEGGIGSSETGLGRGGVGLFVRSSSEIERALRAAEVAGLEAVRLGADESGTVAPRCRDSSQVDAVRARVSVGTMHRAKGLEFSAVAVMACDDDALPLQARIENVADEADLEDVYNTERHLLYVACTRARDRLLVTGVHPASEFLDDLA